MVRGGGGAPATAKADGYPSIMTPGFSSSPGVGILESISP
jgi:hypothetical protein